MDTDRSDERRPFARAYAHIRDSLVAGQYRPGSRLKVRDIAEAIGLSPTPIREALATLAGQAIVLRRPDGGYFVPRQDADEIADLYALEARCLVGHAGGMRKALLERRDRMSAGSRIHDVRSATEWMAACSGSPTLLAAIVLINDRLSGARRAESILWPLIGEPQSWQVDGVNFETSRNELAKYLRTCIRRSHDIAAIMNEENIWKK